MRFRVMRNASALALLSISCSLGDSVDAGSMTVSLEVNDSQLTVGLETMTITVTARNVGYDALSLTGPSNCLLYVEVFNAADQQVWNSNGSCSSSSVTEELPGGEAKVQSFQWNGTSTAGAPLGPGLYLVRGVARTSTGAKIGLPITVALD